MIKIDKDHVEIDGGLGLCLAEITMGVVATTRSMSKHTDKSEIDILINILEAALLGLFIEQEDNEASSNTSVQDLIKQFEAKSKK